MAERARVAPDWSALFNWVLMTVVGFTLGVMFRQAVIGLLLGLLGGTPAKAAEGLIIGLAIGGAQYFALPHRIDADWKWVAASGVGWAVGWSVGWQIGWDWAGPLGFSAVFGVVGGVSGLLAGLLQWLGLRGQFRRAWLWVLVSGGSWAAGMVLSMVVRGALGWPVAGGVAGLLTGAAILLLPADEHTSRF